MKNLNPEKVIEVCHKKFHGTVIVDAWGETGIFYNPDKKLSRGVYELAKSKYHKKIRSKKGFERDQG